jgi:hypothetical protein
MQAQSASEGFQGEGHGVLSGFLLIAYNITAVKPVQSTR